MKCDKELLPDQGLCNRVYKIEFENRAYILREFLNKDKLIDKKTEIKIYKKAASKKIAPAILKANSTSIISNYIDGVHLQRLSHKDIKNIAKVLKKFHKIKIRSAKIDLKNLLPLYHYPLVVNSKKYKKNLALCHNDLNNKNIIFANNIYLIDFEYAMRGDIYFDLASICVEFRLTKAKERYFLKRYFQQKRFDLKKLNIFKTIYQETLKEWFKNKNMI